jgi:glycosyltransferase 2 family protein
MVSAPARGFDRYRRSIGFLLRLGGAAAVIAWLVREAGWDEIVATLGDADPRLLLAAAIAFTFECAVKILNWARLLNDLGCATARRLHRLVHVYLVASMIASVLPSTASTDAMRGLLAQRVFGGRPTSHAAAIIIGNLLVWIAACTIGLVCMAVLAAMDRRPSYDLLVVPLFVGVVAAGVGLQVALKYYRWLWLLALRRVLRRRWFFMRRAIRRLADALLIFERAHVRFTPRAAGAALAATLSALVFAAIAAAVGVDVPLVAWGVLVPLITLSGLLPISIAGLGGAQAVHVLLLAPFGVGVVQAFATSTLYALLSLMFTTVLGSIAWLFGPDLLTPRPVRTAGAIELPSKGVDAP